MEQAIYSSVFGALVENTQVRFDAISKLHKQLYDNVIFEQFLDWDTPSIGLDFEEIIGQYGVSIAAPTIGIDSKEAIIGSEGFETLKEQVFHHALTRPMTIQTYRKVLQLLDSKRLPDEVVKKELVKIMFGDVNTVVDGVLAKIDYIFLQLLFNEGKFNFDQTTNPEGGVRGVYNINQPSENIGIATKDWTDANIDSVDCFEDIQAIIDAAQDKVTFGKILCSPALISYMCRSKKIKQMIWGTDKSARMVQLKDLNEYMSQNSFPEFMPIRRQVRVQNAPSAPAISPIVEANMVFIPDGKLGLVKNAYANSELREEPNVAYSNYGRVRVSQWGVGETQNSNGVEFTKAEVYAMPVITEINGIYTLKTGFQKA